MHNKILKDAGLWDRFFPLVNSKVTNTKAYDHALEGLRGLAALWVAYSHIFFYEFKLDPAYHPAFPFGTFLNAAHGGILVFFMLSGYVIGLSNQLPFSHSNAIRYLLRRFIRLYPIYLAAIALGILSASTDTWKTIVGNLLFLQGPVSALLAGNGVLWTLHYEIVYYIIFLAVWYYQPKVLPLILSSLLVASLPILFPVFPKIVSGYAAGWVFWLFGLWIAWKKPRMQAPSKFPLISYILIYIAIDKLEIGAATLKNLGLVTTKLSEISVVDLVYFPLCALLFAALTQRKLPNSRWYSMIAFILPFSYSIYLIFSGKLSGNETGLIAVAHMILGFLLLRWQVAAHGFACLTFMGSISYGIYVFHMPIMNLMNKISLFSGSPITFMIRTFIWISLTIGISFLFELKIQPLIKQKFQDKVLKYI
jgi:peptidoglycan/LPS O-acetylase OafA/YrhL